MTSGETPAASPEESGDLLEGIDRGIEAHLAWNQKLLRCALLRESPGDDMLAEDAPERCRLGRWFGGVKGRLERHDAALTEAVDRVHRAMHDAVRAMCRKVLAGKAALPEELEAYQRSQTELVRDLNTLRQAISDAAAHTDALTGLPLRHGLEQIFEMRRRDASRLNAAFWVALGDIDHFKAINDSLGHATGDRALYRGKQEGRDRFVLAAE